jgi:hypothetical protein
LGILLVMCIWAQGAFSADKQEEWLYSFQPGDNLWDLTERFLIDQSYWARLVKLNRIKRPRHMPPGMQIRVPLGWLNVKPAVVRVVNMRGHVVHQIPGKKEQQLVPDAWLHKGDRLKVGEDASVLLEFADGTRQLLGSNTEIELIRVNTFSDTGIGDTTLKILRGVSENKVPTRGTRFEIRTPSANTSVRGTSFRVKVPSRLQSTTQVEVIAGEVNVGSNQERLRLPAGFGTVVEKGHAPTPAVKLLSAPQVVIPPSTMRQLPLELRWEPVAGAKAYRVLVAGLGANAIPVVDARVTHQRFSTSALPDGRYRLRVRAIDGAGLEGKESDLAFSLDARPLPPASVAPPANAAVRTHTVAFEWSTAPQVSGYHFQLSPDMQFQSPKVDKKDIPGVRLELDSLAVGTWYWRVASSFQEEQGPWGVVQRFSLKPAPIAPSVESAIDDETLHLHWQKQREGQTYRLQLAEDAGFSRILVDEVLEEPLWSAQRPQSAVHFRVQVIDDDGYAGAWSPAQTVFPEPEPWYLFGIPAIAIVLLAL